MSEIFISYARSTEKQADAVARGLRSLGYDVWRDEDLPAHRAYAEVIEERLAAAAAVVVVWSSEAAKSEWVQSEADAAREAHKLVQLTVDGARRPMPFDRIQCADLTGWTGDPDAPGWRKVVASVHELLRGEAPTMPADHHSHGGAASVEPLLAVLAFDNLSGDPEMAYFSDGVSEEILQTVARGAELKVIGRGSSFQFRGADKAAAHVAAALSATHVLDGSVRRSGSKVRISANLIECGRETTLWSDRFDRELSDVFALQDEIAAAVAAALKVAFAPGAQAETVDPVAYNLYLKALEIRNQGLETRIVLALIKMLAEATSLAPRFGRAWVFLATMQAECLRFDEPEQAHNVTRAQVVMAAEKALNLDPSLGAAYQALGQLEPFGCFETREALHRKALAVAPNDPTVLTNVSLFFAEVGFIREALELARNAYRLDPVYPWAANWYACLLEFDGRPEECSALYDTFCRLWPDNVLIAWSALSAAVDRRDWTAFDDLIAHASERKLDSPMMRQTIAYGRTIREPAAEVRARAVSRARDTLARTGAVSLWTLTTLYTLGLGDEAFELIDRASFAYMLDPELRSPNGQGGPALMFSAGTNTLMMHDVRFVGLCAKLRLCDYWVAAGRWPDCADQVPYDFRAEARRLTDAHG